MCASLRRLGLWREALVVVGIAVVAAGLAACNILSNPDVPRSTDLVDKINSVDLDPRFPGDVGSVQRPPKEPRSASYYGTGRDGTNSDQQTVRPQTLPNGEGYELNFENTPVTTVAKVILGDLLGLGYLIDPRVQGVVNLASGRPVPKGQLLYVLESALLLSNVAMVREDAGYRLLPATEAVGSAPLDRNGVIAAGYGLTALPLQYVSAQALTKLIDSFATRPGAVRVDPTRNLVLIQGTSAERRTTVDVVLSFDADWMRGQSVGIYPVRNSTPEPIISELERIMDSGESGLGQGTVKFQPIGRLNAILVVTQKPDLLRTAATWITRLDRADATSTSVRVYRVRYGDARQLATILNDLFTGNRGGGALDSPTNQIAPSSGLITSSSSTTQQQQGLQIQGSRTQPGGPTTDSPQAAIVGVGSQATSAATISRSSTGPGGVGILPGVRITADTINNALLIYANQENYRIVERTLRDLDRPQLQVAIDATIAEVTLNNNLNYGVQVFLKSSDLGLGNDKGSVIFNPVNASSVLGRVLPGFNFLAGSELEPRFILDALRNVTDVKVLSTPSVVVLDHQIATLQVGDQVPVATATATVLTGTGAPVVNTIDYRNTGVILKVVPRINANGNVLLDVEQEISNVAPNSNATSLTPTVSQRKVKSSISVASGQTVLLGGLISERQDQSRVGLPFLDKVAPAIDDVFSRNSRTVQRTEIIIFIRPQIIRDSVDAQRVAEELRTKLGNRVGRAPPLWSPLCDNCR
jgi:general secretion pathway protein D